MDSDEKVYDPIVVTKTNLKNIIKNTKMKDEKTIHEKINEVVETVNKIVIHTYQFLKLYLLDLYDTNKDFPDIDTFFIRVIMKTITEREDIRGRQPKKETLILMKQLDTFYNRYYRKTIPKNDIIYDDKLGSMLDYEAIDIVKNIKNNITEHFVDYVNKFVNCTFDVKENAKKIDELKIPEKEKKQKKNEHFLEFRNVKSDLLSISTTLNSNEKYHIWIKKHKGNIIPKKDKFSKNSVPYDVCVNPFDYLKSLFYINRELEKLNTSIKQIKLFHPVPLRTNIVPKNITIDTAGLIRILVEENSSILLYNVVKYQHNVWKTYFNLKNKAFKKKKSRYKFDYMIKTDGVSCSILFVNHINNKPVLVSTFLQKKIKDAKERIDKKYIEDTVITEEMKKKTIVTIDPGYSDIIMCLAENFNKTTTITDKKNKILSEETSKSHIKFRYTQAQRKIESGSKKYVSIIEELNNTTKINNKTIKEIELKLSEYNSKTCNFNNFFEYLFNKNKTNKLLFEYYKAYVHRKFKFNRYVNTQRSEANMVNNFKKKFGEPKNVIIVMGDYDKKENMKGKEPTICKKIRKIFRRHHYKTYLINEHNTSKLCNNCCSENENFHYRKSTNPKTEGKTILVWGLVRCTNVNCRLIHNRDINACRNMLKITREIFKGNKRPKEYCRKT